MSENSIEARVREIAERVVTALGLQLVHVEYTRGRRGKSNLTIYIDKPDGVTVDDCSAVSREVEAILDIEDFIAAEYVLEVSSPGLERKLYTREDFKRFKGHAARINTNRKLNGQHKFRGEIIDISDDDIVTFKDRTSGLLEISFDSITLANLEVSMENVFNRAKQHAREGKEEIGQVPPATYLRLR